ncbi:MAG TPA: GNAT family N-acetyltransferase [Chitinophagaceae bacterium]
MMKFQRYGIEMEALQPKHLEMVRLWRNNEMVRLKMQYQEIISQEAQHSWFNTIDNALNHYFIAYHNNTAFGLFHIKNISLHDNKGEAGAFVADEKYLGHANAALAILALMDFAFFELKLDTLEAKYHPSFKEIKALNEQLGYEKITDETDGFIRAEVSRERYLERTGRLRAQFKTTTHIS